MYHSGERTWFYTENIYDSFMITAYLILCTLTSICVKIQLKLLLVDKAEIEELRTGAGLILALHESDLSCDIGSSVYLQKVLTSGRKGMEVKKTVNCLYETSEI